MAGRDAGEAVQVQALRGYLRDIRGGGRARERWALAFHGALRSRMRREGPPGIGRGEGVEPVAGQPASYLIRVAGRWYSWERVRLVLRETLELHLPEGERSREARDLARFLHADRPTLVEYALARPKLEEIWQRIHE